MLNSKRWYRFRFLGERPETATPQHRLRMARDIRAMRKDKAYRVFRAPAGCIICTLRSNPTIVGIWEPAS